MSQFLQNNLKKLVILISGRGSNMAEILRQCQPGGRLWGIAQVAAVVADRPTATGLHTAREHGIPALCVPHKGRSREDFEMSLIEHIRVFEPHFIVCAGFMRILTPCFLRAFAGKVINIHPADTRAYQGANGYLWAYEQGLRQTWVTVHWVDEGVDTGEIILQRPVDLSGATHLQEIEQRGLAVEHALYSEALFKICEA